MNTSYANICKPDAYKRTKIVCTLGPAIDDESILREVIRSGMDVARLNLSHGNISQHLERIKKVRKISSELGKHIAIMMDTRGPDMRIGDLENPPVKLEKGKEVTLTSEQIIGNSNVISVDFPGLLGLLKPGCSVFLHDGLIELQVIESNDSKARCVIIAGGLLSPHKGVNVPGLVAPLPILAESDISDLKKGIKNDIDYISASFVRSAKDIEEIHSKIGSDDIPVIAKIETAQAVENLEEILTKADGVMVARGDLGIEIPPEFVPGVQKKIIKVARSMNKPVITATEMLLSMTTNPRPTRAEIGDIANAVLDGTTAVMLSEETAVGKYPVQAVQFMSKACCSAEKDLTLDSLIEQESGGQMSLRAGIAHAAYLLAHNINASAIICVTDSGKTAGYFSALRPRQPVLACTSDLKVARHLSLYWGIYPILVARRAPVEALISIAVEVGKTSKFLKSGDKIVFTGNLLGRGGETNMLASIEVPA